MSSLHLWNAELIDDVALEAQIDRLSETLPRLLEKRLDLEAFLYACERMSQRLLDDDAMLSRFRVEILGSGQASEKDCDESLQTMADFFKPKNLQAKLTRELGSKNPFAPQRVMHHDHVFECWAPLGLLVHAAPINALTVGVLSVVEGLLAGNVNILKTSSSDSHFPQMFLKELIACDSTNSLRDFIFVVRIPSKNQALLKKVFELADVVAAWGGEESIDGLRRLSPKGARFVDWGPKISFAYVCKSRLDDERVMESLAEDICVFDQQACSSPQVVYVETESHEVLRGYAEKLSMVLARVSERTTKLQPSMQEQAEITSVSELAKLSACLNEGAVFEANDRSWRVLAEYKPGLRASPLYRSIWVKPLPRARIVEVLQPLRSYLQTVGLAGDPNDITNTSVMLSRAGLQRINLIGQMHKSYMGEPHDGKYALQCYAKRISFQFDGSFKGISNLDDLALVPMQAPSALRPSIMTKEDFQSAKVSDEHAQLFFKSGGSSGAPKLSIFTYDDYHAQMNAAAEGLYAAGLDPINDRSMNLFFGGGLYGGFVSFFSILESIKAVQLPMAVIEDYRFVVDMIIANRVNVLLGMPSFMIQLFEREAERLKAYGGIKKIFYGGEHFNAKQVAHLKTQFGIERIVSATYGSVDAGPLGYQCEYTQGSVHHLHTKLQDLEILQVERDEAVPLGEIGRLVFSSKMREGQQIKRYDIGDLGRFVVGPCECGRTSPRFELLGRHGDICRIGTIYLNYRKLCNIIADYFDYAGEVQLRLDRRGSKELVEIRMTPTNALTAADVRRVVLENYRDLGEVVSEGLVEVETVFMNSQELSRTPGSGKLRSIIDAR